MENILIVEVASKCRDAIIDVLNTKLPDHFFVSQDYQTRDIGGKPISAIFTNSGTDASISIDECDTDTTTIYYKRLPRFGFHFKTSTEMTRLLVKGLGERGSAVVIDTDGKCRCFYDGKKVYTQKENWFFEKITTIKDGRKSWFNEIGWFDWIADQFPDITDDKSVPEVSAKYRKLLDDYDVICENAYLQSIRERLEPLSNSPEAICIAGKSFVICVDQTGRDTPILNLIKKRINERGGSVRLLPLSKNRSILHDDYYLLYKNNTPLMSLLAITKMQTLSEMDLWASIFSTEPLEPEAALQMEKKAYEERMCREKSVNDETILTDSLEQRKKQIREDYLEKVNQWIDPNLNVKDYLIHKRFTEDRIRRLSFDKSIDFEGRHFYCSHMEGTAYNILREEIEKLGGKMDSFISAQTTYTVISEPYRPDIVGKIIMEGVRGNCQIITDIQLWRAIRNVE